MMKKIVGWAIIVSGLVVLASVLAIRYYPSLSVFGDWSDLSCTKTGDSISCSMAYRYGSEDMCTSSACGDEWNFCVYGPIQGLPSDIKTALGESGSYTTEQKQEIYDNFAFSGSCSLGYMLDYAWGECGLRVKGRTTYRQLSQEHPVELDRIDVDGWQQIMAYFGTFGNRGSCSFTTKVTAAPTPPGGTLAITFVGIIGGLAMLATGAGILLI